MQLSMQWRLRLSLPGPQSIDCIIHTSQAPKNALARKDIEYYVKWRDRAHIHCSWVSGPQMEAAVARSTGRGALNRARLKLQAFERAQVHGEVRGGRVTIRQPLEG